ncbi:MAG: type IV secretory system conjugative DNA transfer family protein [Pseudonocardiaceae bacterium]
MSSRSALSPTADRDLALMGLTVAALAALMALGAALTFGAAITTGVLGGPWRVPGISTWMPAVFTVLGSPAHPGTALGEPWAAALAGHPGLYWTVTVPVVALGAATLTALCVPAWRRFGPTPAGHASRHDIRQELSLAAARSTAQWTRPGLSPAQRRQAPLEEVAAPLHRGPHGEPMCTPLENPTGTLAPTQSGKSRRDLVHKVIGAPGALLCSTTKPDLLEFSALSRARRAHAGPVLVYDATGAVSWPAKLRWSPIAGCEDPDVARRRAHTMVEAASVQLAGVGGNDKVFRDRAKTVLQAYLMAAAIHGHDVAALVRWAVSKPPDQEPVKLLQEGGYPELARNLRAEIGMVAETSDAVWMSVRRVIEPLMEPRLRQLCTPRAGEEFDARSFIAAQGSLYLIAGQHQAAQAAPLLTALVEHWLTTGQDMALDYPHRRVDPPASTVLDEVTNATPVPQLPDIVSDSAGRGVLIHWAAQSLAKLEDVYGAPRARQLLDNTTTLSVWGGLKDQRALEWVSLLAGHHDRLRYQQHSTGMLSPGRTAVGTETVPTYRPGAVRSMRRGQVLVIHRTLPPILARTVDVTARPDWDTIRADIDAVRTGSAPVTPAGYALTPTATPERVTRW